MTFAEHVYAVTGGASGIGRSLTKLLAEAGAFVYISDVDEHGLDETVNMCKVSCRKPLI
jgi:NAD(P)-dependent dehydrogenase (short-subunit alcohol dehydrogenase family)